MKVNSTEDCDCHQDIGFGDNCIEGKNCEHCQCNEVENESK